MSLNSGKGSVSYSEPPSGRRRKSMRIKPEMLHNIADDGYDTYSVSDNAVIYISKTNEISLFTEDFVKSEPMQPA